MSTKLTEIGMKLFKLPRLLSVKPGFHYKQTPRPRHKNKAIIGLSSQSSFTLIALFRLEIGRCRGRNWLNGNQALQQHVDLYCSDKGKKITRS